MALLHPVLDGAGEGLHQMKFDTPYTVDDKRSASFATINKDPSLTTQSDAADADINIIMKRYGATGQFPQLTKEGIYGDFTQVTDYGTALHLVQQADEAFSEIPAEIRRKFNNNPQEFLEFVHNPENRDEIKKLGLTIPEKIPETTLGDIANILKENKDGSADIKPPAK